MSPAMGQPEDDELAGPAMGQPAHPVPSDVARAVEMDYMKAMASKESMSSMDSSMNSMNDDDSMDSMTYYMDPMPDMDSSTSHRPVATARIRRSPNRSIATDCGKSHMKSFTSWASNCWRCFSMSFA